LVKQFSRSLFTQPKGILESFIDYSLGNILRPLFDQHQKEVHDAALGKSSLTPSSLLLLTALSSICPRAYSVS
jgi:hypothetical protein